MSLLDEHERNLASGYVDDPDQRRVIQALDRVACELIESATKKRSVFGRLLGTVGRQVAVRGLYVWGGVGRGKTYLMDLFFEWLPIERKKRMHFHRFMQRVHADLRRFAGQANPLERVADRFADEAIVICFDEFFVSDIGDAMIMGELFNHLFDRRVALVATSNVEPKRLYENGLQRRRFLPTIDLIEAHCEILHMGGDVDYRLRVLREARLFRVMTHGEDASGALLKDFAALAPGGYEDRELTIEINGRFIDAVRQADDVIWFDFTAICETPRSQSDYIELARLFHTVVVADIPVLDGAREDAARRFISLVDEFYDRNVKLLVSSHAAVEDLYAGERLEFEFERTRSRLIEMQSEAYLMSEHRP